MKIPSHTSPVASCEWLCLKLEYLVANTVRGHVSESVMYVRDGTGFDRYFLGAPRHFTDQDGVILRINNTEAVWAKRPAGTTQPTTSSPETRPAKALKIPRPPNAYILYRKERHSMVKEAHPGITNNQICQFICPPCFTSQLTFSSPNSR